MSNNTSGPESPENDDSNDLFVLDFLYHDSRRIGSFLSQFESDGILQQTTWKKEGSKGKKEGATQEGKMSLKVLSGSRKGETETAHEMIEGLTRVFDPYWTNARAFLDHLSENDLLRRDLVEAELGQFVLVKGFLSVLDLAMFKDAWKLQSIQKKVREGTLPTGRHVSNMTAAQKAEHKEAKDNADLMLDMMQILPHSVHSTLLSDTSPAQMVWCSLNEEYLTTPASEITLSHGAMMPGEWTIVGILSAKPEYLVTEPPAGDFNDPGFLNSIVGNLSAVLAPIVRTVLGRPAAAHAVTPLLIFREVT